MSTNNSLQNIKLFFQTNKLVKSYAYSLQAIISLIYQSIFHLNFSWLTWFVINHAMSLLPISSKIM